MNILKQGWWRMKEFAGVEGGATYLWPRWWVLRAVGLVYLIIFAGILVEGTALIGPEGIVPVSHFCEMLEKIFPNVIERLIRAPSFFWLSNAPGMIHGLGYCGLGAAIALVLNLWPRMALFACWSILLSFISVWQIFSPTIIDQLMLEVALVCIAWAPAGFRPGLGIDSPPRAIAVFMLRWLLLRIMLESGLVKVFAGDSHWRDFTALDVMYETNPSPTLLGYYDAHFPHAYHVFEIVLTLMAEIVGPVLAVFGGRRGRWIALGLWVILQGGIQLTGNFGWLNTAAIALGLVLLDDQMISDSARRLGLRRLAERISNLRIPATLRRPRWRTIGMSAFLWLHFALSLYFLGVLCTGKTVQGIPDAKTRPIDYLFRDFRSANAYFPFASFPMGKFEIEFAGSNDNGQTWRFYPFRYKPQQEDRIGPFIAPWFARFDSALQLALQSNSPIIPIVARKLILRNPEVMRLFESDPFPDQRPHIVRIVVFRMAFTDLATYRKTREFWTKNYEADLTPPIYLNEAGQVVEGR
ncbi:MAG: lipase maturation factor family protein [Opitutus sp.]